jgi:hypothetical protein
MVDIPKGGKMNVTEKARENIQALVNKGEIFCIGNKMAYQRKGTMDAHYIGTEDDLPESWNVFAALIRAGK